MKWKLTIITVLLVLFMLASPLSASVGDSLDFSGNVAEMKGHFDMAIFNLEKGDRELSAVHAGHPVEEYWILIGGEVRDRDLELFQALDKELAEIPGLVETASTAELEAKVNEISDLLDRTEALVVPQEIRTGFIFKTKVALSLLDTAKAEYSAGVSDTGEIKEMAEYQDSVAFVKRAEGIYRDIRGAVDVKEANEIDGFFEELTGAMAAKQSPTKVETMANGIVHKLKEVADISEVKEEKEPIDIIEDIEVLLQQVVREYEGKKYDEADELAVRAYLDNFELVEGSLGNMDAELMSELEQLMRVQLRQLIRDRAPASEVEELVDRITGKLETAKSLLRGEAPPAIEETKKEVVQPPIKVERPSMAPWYGAVAVLLVIALVEAVTIYKLKSERK